MSHRQRSKSGSEIKSDFLACREPNAEDDDTENGDPNKIQCAFPAGCVVSGEPILLNDMSNVQKIICSYEACPESSYMHIVCFEKFEEEALNYLKSCGRARSWSEKQRRQNIWSKKGYDLTYKICGCKCGKGHIKKDLDWEAPSPKDDVPMIEVMRKGRKKRKNALEKPTACAKNYQRSLSEHSIGSSPPTNDSPDQSPRSPLKGKQLDENHTSCSPPALSNTTNFLRRMDYGSFTKVVNKSRLNPFCVKMECEDGPGDDTRLTIFQSMSSQRTNNIPCLACSQKLFIFDRYPLIEGAFFLSPIQHHTPPIPVNYNEKTHYLVSLCLHCIEEQDRIICRVCSTPWKAGSLCQLGTLYYFDILAAHPCCSYRFKCKACQQLIADPVDGLNYFSEYSHCVLCSSCNTTDHHYVKPFNECYYIRK